MDPLPNRPYGQMICKANYFKFETTAKIFKYNVKFDPDVSENQMKFFMKMINKLRPQLAEKLKFFYPQNFLLYSPEAVNDDMQFSVEEENRKYEVSITMAGFLSIGQDKESLNFFGRFFKILQAKLRLQQIGRKYFDPKEGKQFKDLRLEVWPGFATSLNNYGPHFLVNVDTSYKILREDSALDVINDLVKTGGGDTHSNIENALTGTTVMTKYLLLFITLILILLSL